MDLHDGASNRRRVAEELNHTLAATGEALDPDVTRLHRQLELRRKELEDYAEALHRSSGPWNVSAFEAQQRILGIPEDSQTAVRYRGSLLASMGRDLIEEACEDIRRFVELGGPSLLLGSSPWSKTYEAQKATAPDTVTEILEKLQTATSELARLQRLVQLLSEASSLRVPDDLSEVRAQLDLMSWSNEVLEAFEDKVFDLNLDELASALKPARLLPLRLVASSLSSSYRGARSELRDCLRQAGPSDSELRRLCVLAGIVSKDWTNKAPSAATPRQTEGLTQMKELFTSAQTSLRALTSQSNAPISERDPISVIRQLLDQLAQDRTILLRMPELHSLERRLRDSNLGDVLDEVFDLGLSSDGAAQALEHAWLASVLEHISTHTPELAAFDGNAQDAAVEDFILADKAHLDISSDRVRRAWAEKAVATRDAYRYEASQVAKQASLRRRHMPIRDLFDQAEHVLTAVKPCWVMSPLVVAQVLPARQCFDVVIFDEASQIPPADAACSLLRGRQAIVAGDPHQLPPTTFFSSQSDDDAETKDDDLENEVIDERVAAALELSFTEGQESNLDVMSALLPVPYGTRTLNWHYRSKDERLITFSNAQESLYDWSLTTFPGAFADNSIDHVLVPFRPGALKVTASVPDEVERVRDLVIQHLLIRPSESLGVIALGNSHAEQISEALRVEAANRPELAAALDAKQDEHLFVKNLERVQGDERDAIILTVGYGKTLDGRMRYHFGPVNQVGGERRLNVAITRARRRMTIVSSFSGSELDPSRVNSIGAKMLRDYLLYAESGGANLGLRAKSKPVLNPFERDIQEQLEAHGLVLVPQYGASGYWIDFAAMHPSRPSEPVLAIEADGVMYHSSPTARDRDRLRQEHLERLGWSFHRIWSTDWFRSREQEVQAAVGAYYRAIKERDGTQTTESDDSDEPDWLSPSASASSGKRANWPGVLRGHEITYYSTSALRDVVRWVRSDGRLYTEDELLTEVMEALRFGRRGARIVQAITQAIRLDR